MDCDNDNLLDFCIGNGPTMLITSSTNIHHLVFSFTASFTPRLDIASRPPPPSMGPPFLVCDTDVIIYGSSTLYFVLLFTNIR